MTNELAEKPMSYEKMIDTLKGLVFGTFDRTTSKEREALGRAIDLLSNSDKDCISRKAVLNTLDSMDKALTEDRTVEEYKEVLEECYKMLPSIYPKPKTDVLDKIRAEIDRQEKWLLQAGCTTYNVDIALDAIKAVVAEKE